MSDSAFQIQYRRDAIMGFEQGMSLLRHAVTPESVIKGNQATFLVADSGAATATTRGLNGRIPSRSDSLNQYTATLVEWHDLVERTSFNIFASQGDGTSIMQKTTTKVLNRKRDADILAALANTTYKTNSAGVTASLSLVLKAWGILGNNQVPMEEEDDLFIVVSPAVIFYMMQIPEFTKASYCDVAVLAKEMPGTQIVRKYRRFAGFNWIVHPNLTGNGTSAEYCYAFHRSAIGHAMNSGEMQALAGYHERQDFSWARTTGFMGSVMLQAKGIVQIIHDGSAVVSA